MFEAGNQLKKVQMFKGAEYFYKPLCQSFKKYTILKKQTNTKTKREQCL